MSNTKTIVLLGGTGFVGRAIAEKYLLEGYYVVITTRSTPEVACATLSSHGFPEDLLQEKLSTGRLHFIAGADLSQSKWQEVATWSKVLRDINVSTKAIKSVVNLVTDTSGTAEEIEKSGIRSIKSIVALVRYLKVESPSLLFGNMGSVAEKSKALPLPPYEKAKKILRAHLEESGLCDYHFIAAYIKGRGEKKMTHAAPKLWQMTKISSLWYTNFEASIIDVDDLAEIIYYFLEQANLKGSIRRPIEINVTNGELTFSDIVWNLLPTSLQIHYKSFIPAPFGRLYLWIYAIIAPKIWPKDQIVARMSEFARLSLMPLRQSKLQNILMAVKSAAEIKSMAQNKDFEIICKKPFLAEMDVNHSTIYCLKERSCEQLIKIIRKSVSKS